MCGNDDDPTMEAADNFRTEPQLGLLDPHLDRLAFPANRLAVIATLTRESRHSPLANVILQAAERLPDREYESLDAVRAEFAKLTAQPADR